MALYETIATSNPDWLLSGVENVQAIAISVEPSQGTLKRGTVLYRKSNGMYAAAASANVTTDNALVILNKTVDTTVSATIAETVDAYRSGRFVAGRVKLAADAALTAAHEQVLRLQGIVFDKAQGAAEFNNTVAAQGSGT